MADVVIEKPKSFWQSLHPRRMLSLRLFGHLAALLPLALLGVDALRHKLTVNPIQYLTQQLGIDAMLLLAASLALTPLITLTGLHQLQRLSRPLGLYAFLYTTLHVLLFVGVDYGFSWTYLWEDMQGKNYFLTGILSFVILVALAATSFRWWMRKMGKEMGEDVGGEDFDQMMNEVESGEGDGGEGFADCMQVAAEGKAQVVSVTGPLFEKVPATIIWLDGGRTAVLEAAQAKPDRSVAALTPILAADPNLYQAHYTLGLALAQTGKYAEAAKHLHKAIELQPDAAWAHYAIGASLLKTGDYKTAAVHLEIATTRLPDFAAAHLYLAEAYEHTGRAEQAKQERARAQ